MAFRKRGDGSARSPTEPSETISEMNMRYAPFGYFNPSCITGYFFRRFIKKTTPETEEEEKKKSSKDKKNETESDSNQ